MSFPSRNQSRKRSYQESNEIFVLEEQSKDKDRKPIIIEDIDFDDLNSLINFNRVYHLYYQCLENRDDKTRSQCVRFFVDYHKWKFLHYFDVEGYTKFIVDVFFDPSLDVIIYVFNNMLSFKSATKSLIKDISNRITNDIRQLEIDNNQLKKRFDIYTECCLFRIKKIKSKDHNKLGMVNNNNNIENIVNTREKEIGNGDSSNSMTKEKVSNRIISDLLVDRIISFSLREDQVQYGEKRYQIEKEELNNKFILNFALVSKQFFRVASKKMNDNYHNMFGYVNVDNEYSLIKSPPLFFDYESIKFIRYDDSAEQITQFFSRVELFHIKSDEYDVKINGAFSREYINVSNDNSYEDFYSDVITCDGYLTYLPPMPNLKNIFVHEYFGYQSNYSSFLISIFENTPNVDGHGIESFYINIKKDWNSTPDDNNLDFLQPLLSLHSKTLKSVTLEYYHIYREGGRNLLSSLKKMLPTIKQYNYSFIIYGNFKKLRYACRDNEDLQSHFHHRYDDYSTNKNYNSSVISL
ncbi:hypothetical protein PPL_06608 [Heterostelium album PN500]|uniref:Uncharacterized protein n=1 Tax=Heterostelium pallidum (strain ATCC 26659 / Pp 5 / PN500) TaxID=670386 RepID=D3BF75_HETP5|nr:hypothetical protein PPL_06608 [Heterostelium album PN500]EFA79789.1 hypothetical protein PPL_06608 [Heterostelium album PN500]|eukprot:XP_020431910.1 hypothetical protein PPL_06608 [Heterostelium album PN500]